MTIGSPKLTDFVLAQILTNILHGDNTVEVIKKTAALIDDNLDERFKSKSEDIQQNLVLFVLLPLCAELMKENKNVYKTMLFQEWKKIDLQQTLK